MMRTIAVIGASSDQGKFGNKAIRAYLKQGWAVYPIHPKEAEIEGLKVCRSIRDIQESLDRVALYVAPKIGLQLLDEIASVKPKELFVNPGADSPELMKKAEDLGLNPVFGCAIIVVGEDPSAL